MLSDGVRDVGNAGGGDSPRCALVHAESDKSSAYLREISGWWGVASKWPRSNGPLKVLESAYDRRQGAIAMHEERCPQASLWVAESGLDPARVWSRRAGACYVPVRASTASHDASPFVVLHDDHAHSIQ